MYLILIIITLFSQQESQGTEYKANTQAAISEHNLHPKIFYKKTRNLKTIKVRGSVRFLILLEFKLEFIPSYFHK